MSLLIDEYPLMLLPKLAVRIGLNEAIMLQQVHWLCGRDTSTQRDGRGWVYNTPDGWLRWFPFFSVATIRRTLEELRKTNLLIAAQLDGPTRPLFYRVSDEAKELLSKAETATSSDGVNDSLLKLSKEPAQNERARVLKLSTLLIDTDSNRDNSPEVAAPKKPRAKRNTTPPAMPEGSERGLKFADWFKTLLPTEIRLTSNWRQNWAKCFDDMIRLDSRTEGQIAAVCKWAREDSFWKTNFFSPMKLREKKNDVMIFDQLSERMKAPARQNGGPTPKGGAQLPENQRPRGISVADLPDIEP